MVYGLELRVRLEPGKRTPQAHRPIDFTGIIVHKAFDLAVVEHHAIGFITYQAAQGRRVVRRDQVRGNMDHIRLQTEGLIRFEIDLVPAEDFIRRDLERLADGFLVSQ